MSEAAPNFESLLREALAPVEPPADLVERVEGTLTSITEMAADELEAWELSAMRDPRNWARPAAALVIGGTAGAALVVLRARRRAHAAPGGVEGVRDTAERTLRDIGRETRRLLGDRWSRRRPTGLVGETFEIGSLSRTWPPATATPRARRGSPVPTVGGRSVLTA
jgi:hypothetical protein